MTLNADTPFKERRSFLISLEKAKTFPTAYQAILKKWSKKRSRHRDLPPEEMIWSVELVVPTRHPDAGVEEIRDFYCALNKDGVELRAEPSHYGVKVAPVKVIERDLPEAVFEILLLQRELQERARKARREAGAQWNARGEAVKRRREEERLEEERYWQQLEQEREEKRQKRLEESHLLKCIDEALKDLEEGDVASAREKIMDVRAMCVVYEGGDTIVLG